MENLNDTFLNSYIDSLKDFDILDNWFLGYDYSFNDEMPDGDPNQW